MSSARTVVARSASSRTSLPLLRGTVPGSSVLHRDRLSSTGCDLEVDTSFTGRRVVAVLNLLVAMRGNLQTGGREALVRAPRLTDTPLGSRCACQHLAGKPASAGSRHNA